MSLITMPTQIQLTEEDKLNCEKITRAIAEFLCRDRDLLRKGVK